MQINPNKSIVAIGDIHGCSKTLMALYHKLMEETDSKDRTWVFIGDYIDRGPDSKGVVDALLQISDVVDCVFLRGNHEQMLIETLDGDNPMIWLRNGANLTLKSYGSKVPKLELSSPHFHFYQNTKLFYESKDYVFVHGGLLSFLTIQEQLDKEEALHSVLWEREHIDAEEFVWEKKVVFGHTPKAEPIHDEFRIGIDTGCVYKLPGLGRLTAVLLPEERFISQACVDQVQNY